jgi:hypothetical protein
MASVVEYLHKHMSRVSVRFGLPARLKGSRAPALGVTWV